MPRKKTAEQMALSALKLKNQSTQYNFYVKECGTVGVQTMMNIPILKLNTKDKSSQTDNKVMAEIGVGNEIQFQPKTCIGTQTNSLSVCSTEMQTENYSPATSIVSETQTEIFGSYVPPEKWEEINILVKARGNGNIMHSHSRKRRLNESQTCTRQQITAMSQELETQEHNREVPPEGIAPKQLALVKERGRPISPLPALKFYFQSVNTSDLCFKEITNHDHEIVVHIEVIRSNGLIGVSTYYDYPTKLMFSSNGKVAVLTLFKPTTEFEFFNKDTKLLNLDVVKMVLRELDEDCVFCPGLTKDELETLKDTKKLKKHHVPFERIQSKECLVWFKPPTNAPKDKLLQQTYQCSKCRALKWYIKGRSKKMDQVTPKTKLKRQAASSKCRIGVLTPKSKNKRILQNKQNRFKLTQKIKHLENKIKETSLELNENQDKNMSEVLNEINTKGKEDLNEIFKLAMKKNKIVGLALKKAWQMNSKRDCENGFLNDQEKCIKGSNGNRWSPLTYRIALAVYSRSPAAYEALNSFDILKLPSAHTLRDKIRQYPSNSGIDYVHLQKESERFDNFVNDHPEYNKPPKEGALIFDEVKIIGKLMWNSKNGEFVGCAIDSTNFASMEDLFKCKTTSELLEAEYALQYLWRCTTTKFDVIGPYFMFEKPASHAAISSCTLKCIFAFHNVGFEVGLLVCDGGSANMTAMRKSLGITRAQSPSVNEDGSLDFRFSTKFRNPLHKESWIYWIVCPTHQLKNMINALHNSQIDGTRDFSKSGVRFGWTQIKDMKKREDHRVDSDELVQVKGLLKSYVDRDSWTKLNMTPASIMQQMPVLGELYNYANPMFEAKPVDRSEVMACYDYLRACHDIFEEGLLSHKPVYCLDSDPMKSMFKGLKYFEEWATERINEDANVSMTNNPKFLAWQTWELLRVSVYGFADYIKDFTTRHPKRYVFPVRINGSAVETIFSQMKYVTAGKLTSLNYSSARRALLIKGCTKTSQNAEASYRKVGLDICEK